MKGFIFLGAGIGMSILATVFAADIDSLLKAASGPCSSLDFQISIDKASTHIDHCLSLTGDVATTDEFSTSAQSIQLALSGARTQGKEKLFISDVKQINSELAKIRDEMIDRGEL